MSKGRILVVEDHPDNQQLVTWILEDEDYEVTCAGTAEEGLSLLDGAYATAKPYIAVLMDISLPGIDGKEATKRLRGKDEFRNLPVYALTAHGVESEQQSIMQSGVTGLLTKPIDEEQLIQVLAGIGHA